MQNSRKKSQKRVEKALKSYNSRPKKSQKEIKKHTKQMQRLRKFYVAAQRAQLNAMESIPYDPDWSSGEGSGET